MRTLKDKLSHMTYLQAVKLLGTQGKELLMAGGKFDIDVFEQVTLDNESFQLKLEDAIVDIRLDPMKHQRNQMTCSACPVICVHQGAALSLILEEKMALGLAAPPPERVPVESLSEAELIDQAISDRKERAQKEKMRLASVSPHDLWTDYVVTNQVSGKSYRIALRGWKPGESYCSCPDFRKIRSAPASTFCLHWKVSERNSTKRCGKPLLKSRISVFTFNMENKPILKC
jgi:hypothetical protein